MVVELLDCKNCDGQVYLCRNFFVRDYYWEHKNKFFIFPPACKNPEPISKFDKKELSK